jgi:hypothetical protein
MHTSDSTLCRMLPWLVGIIEGEPMLEVVAVEDARIEVHRSPRVCIGLQDVPRAELGIRMAGDNRLNSVPMEVAHRESL